MRVEIAYNNRSSTLLQMQDYQFDTYYSFDVYIGIHFTHLTEHETRTHVS
jgi:hypothetical protein